MLDQIPHSQHLLELRMARPPANALDPSLIVALRDAVRAAPANGYRALVLSGAPGMFSAGLDVQALSLLPRPEIEAFYANFTSLWETLAGSEIPIAAAITGHAPAGGAALSIFCDFSVMAQGNYRIGLNEVAVGLSVPSQICKALAKRVGHHIAEQMLVEGRLILPEEALRVGMVDETVEVDQVIPRALDWCEGKLALPQQAFLKTRKIARQPLMVAFADPDPTPAGFGDMWFGEEAQATVRKLIERLKSKK